MHTLVAVMVTTLAAKLLVEGVHTLPKYGKARGSTTLGEQERCPIAWCACDMYALMRWNAVTLS